MGGLNHCPFGRWGVSVLGECDASGLFLGETMGLQARRWDSKARDFSSEPVPEWFDRL